MRIGELARAAGVNVQTVRFYERMDLLPATHRWPGSGYRDFDDEALSRLRFIRSAKDLGFTLREIKELMEMRFSPGESCAEVKRLLEIKQEELNRRMQEMRRLHRALGKLIAACRRRSTKTTCPALWAIALKARS